jgi:hypothetical protein
MSTKVLVCVSRNFIVFLFALIFGSENLQAGDRLLNDDGTWAEVVGVEIEAEPLTAFNLTVAEFHTYFVAANENASPVWVHNDCFDFDDFQRIHQNLDEVALNRYRNRSTDDIVDSLLNGAGDQRLQVSSDGRIFNGNHRIEALRERGYDLTELRSQMNSSHLHDTSNSFIPPGLE